MYKLPKVVEEWFEYMKHNEEKSDKTIIMYKSIINKFLSYMVETKFTNTKIENFSQEKLKAITNMDINNFKEFCSKELKNGTSAKNTKVFCLRTFFDYLQSQKKIIDTNPASEIETAKVDEREPKYLTLEECQKLLELVEKENNIRNKTIVNIFLHCGLRLSELSNLNISDIKKNKLYVIGKGNKQRKVPINNICMKVIDEYLVIRKDMQTEEKDALFLSKLGSRIYFGTVQSLITRLLKTIGRDDLSTHKLRHTCFTLLYANGVGLLELKKLAGHKNVSTTEIYTHIDDPLLMSAVNKNPLNILK